MWTEEKLNELLTTPSDKLVEDVKRLTGDIMILGAGGKMGPTLAILAANAIKKAGVSKRVIAVSRFSDPIAYKYLEESGVEIISCDLLDVDALNALPEVENVIYMAGRKFGTDGQEYLTWAMNATLPAFVAYKFRKSKIIVFSSGNIYPLQPLGSGGSLEEDRVAPVGEYAQSCLARERAFEYASKQYGTKVLIYRLNAAVDIRYGVFYDIARNILDGKPVSLTNPGFNCIWQGSANEIAIRSLLHCESPARILNVTGPEFVSVRYAAKRLSAHLGREVTFVGKEENDAYISNAGKSFELFGYPDVSVETMLRWQAEYILAGCRTLNKPTHFEERKGSF